MSKRVRISNERLNCYGTRVLTSGMDVQQYCRNPVLLYQHERGNVIGYVEDLRVENGEITGELMFDEASELSKRCKKQFEFGSLRMVSIGSEILETSDDKQYLLPGQTRPTITKCKLYEVSLVDVGANDDAIVLRKDGELITLGKNGECSLPLLNNQPNFQQMDQKKLALLLGLPETADEAAITEAIGVLNAAKTENEALKKEKETLTLAGITAAVETAISEKRITSEKKQQFIELGKKVGTEELKNVFAAMSPQVKLTQVIGHHGGAPTGNAPTGGTVTYKKLSEVPEETRVDLRENNPDEYKKLFKAEYGFDCEL